MTTTTQTERARAAVRGAIRHEPCPDGGGVPTERVIAAATRGRRVSRDEAVTALEDLAVEGVVYESDGWRV